MPPSRVETTGMPDLMASRITSGKQSLEQVLPGVDRMVQTTYMGTLRLTKGTHMLSLRQTQPNYILEPLGLELKQIILRRK